MEADKVRITRTSFQNQTRAKRRWSARIVAMAATVCLQVVTNTRTGATISCAPKHLPKCNFARVARLSCLSVHVKQLSRNEPWVRRTPRAAQQHYRAGGVGASHKCNTISVSDSETYSSSAERAQIRLVVLDWDGTVVDSIAHIVDSWAKAIKDHRPGQVPSEIQLRQAIGLSVDAAIELHCPGISEEMHKAISASYSTYFRAGKKNIQMFPGVREGLERLGTRGAILAVATGKKIRSVQEELDTHCLNEFFVTARAADITRSKPHPQMLWEIMDETGVYAANTIMVGDSAVDVQLAKNAGVRAVAVSFGAESESALIEGGASVCANSWPDLIRVIEGYLEPQTQ